MKTLPDRKIVSRALAALLMGGSMAGLLGGLLGGCAADLPRDINGAPFTSRLAPNAVPPPPVTAEQKQQLTALNAQILRDQESVIARQQEAQAWAYAAYPYTNWNMYYGGWGGGWGGGSRWGYGVSVGSPGYWGGGWGGYPYGWW
ncbi:hypothetical protein [Cupriavidus pauculus]